MKNVKITAKDAMFLQQFKNKTVNETRVHFNGRVSFQPIASKNERGQIINEIDLDLLLAEYIKRGVTKTIKAEMYGDNLRVTVDVHPKKMAGANSPETLAFSYLLCGTPMPKIQTWAA